MKHQVELKPHQKIGYKLAQGESRFILYRGGSRSGKTYLNCHIVLMRALAAPNGRHTILRKTAVDVRRTLFDLTFRQVMDKAYPGLWEELVKERRINDKEMSIRLPNGSIILFDGLDDSTRQDRILGDEYTTIYVSECDQFMDFGIIETLMGRLNLEPEIEGMPGRKMAPKMFFDCNPTYKRHWTYQWWIEKNNPSSGSPWNPPEELAEFKMNPEDNVDNIARNYLNTLKNFSAAKRKRFLEGEWANDNDNAMFNPMWWEGDGKHKRLAAIKPEDSGDLFKIVAVDPAGSSKKGSDETGIIVLGIDLESGHVYVLADRSNVYTPPQWAAEVKAAYDLWDCNYVVAEDNFGKEMVPNTLRMHGYALPIKTVTATRGTGGKMLRADPIASLYEQGLVHHCGTFATLEDQLASFHRDYDRKKDGSPDRLDALVWGVTELAVKEIKKNGASQQMVVGLWR